MIKKKPEETNAVITGPIHMTGFIKNMSVVKTDGGQPVRNFKNT